MEEKPEAATPDGGPVDDMAVRNARRELLVRTKGKWAGFGDIIRVPTPPEPLLITEHRQWMLNTLVPLPAEGVPRSFEHALAGYEAVRAREPALAAAGVGTMRFFGWGIPQSHREALSLFREAARLAHGRGEAGLGIMYANGIQVGVDYVKARRLLHMGASQNDVLAMHEIGRLYWLQLGCQMDHSEAEKWYKVASELGYAESQFALGQAYQYGTVAHPSHLETAAKYFAMAAQQGHQLAIEGAAWVKSRLWTPDQQAQLERARARRAAAQAAYDSQVAATKAHADRLARLQREGEEGEDRYLSKLDRHKARQTDLDTAQQLFERESERAVIAESELATKQGALVLSETNLSEALRTVQLLEDRIMELVGELTKRQHRHSDAGGVWEAGWVPREWKADDPRGMLWKPLAGVRDAQFVERWSCCQCTNRYSYFCKPVCGCEDFSDRFCKGPPHPPPDPFST